MVPLRADVYTHWGQIFGDIFWIAMSALLCLQACRNTYGHWTRGFMATYWQDRFFVLDHVCVLSGLALMLYFGFRVHQLEMFNSLVVRRMTSPSDAIPMHNAMTAPDTEKVRMVLDNFAHQRKLADMLDQASYVIVVTRWQGCFALLYSMVVVSRYFRGFSGQPRLATIVQTLLASRQFLMHYVIIFSLVMCSFAFCGHILFGECLAEWATLGGAIAKLFMILSGRFEYVTLYSVAPMGTPIWFTAFFLSTALLLLALLTGAIVHRYLEVRAKLGESGENVWTQLQDLFDEKFYSGSYQGSQRSAPPEELLNLLCDLSNPDEYARIHRLGTLQLDRRLRTREDVECAETDVPITAEFLVDKGMDQHVAHHLLSRCSKAQRLVSTTSDPTHMLLLMMMRHHALLRREAEHGVYRIESRAAWTADALDRIDLKLGKCMAMTKRVARSQQLPHGWSKHYDQFGQKYVRHDDSGLTSWTLPKGLV